MMLFVITNNFSTFISFSITGDYARHMFKICLKCNLNVNQIYQVNKFMTMFFYILVPQG